MTHTNELTIVPFHEDHAAAFQRLNLEWIEKYFEVEPKDVEQTSNPRALVESGGEVFFILRDGAAVATCAVLPWSPGVYEIAKMAVDPRERGRGLGNLLMRAAIDWAKARRARKIAILSNTVLEPAIALYRKFGFQTVSRAGHPDYRRCNIEMELVLHDSDRDEVQKA